MCSHVFSACISKFNLLLFTITLIVCVTSSSSDVGEESGDGLYKLEGKVVNLSQYTTDENWILSARILVDGGTYVGIIKPDGFFTVSGIPSGSYVIEVVHPYLAFDSVRVEINSKGKIRARGLDNVQPFQVKNVVAYPLRMACRGRFQYFQQREQWRLSEMLFNPMVLMMFLPVLMMFVIPKLMNSQDPEIQKEMQQSMSWMTPKSNMPDLSEMITSWLGSKAPPSSSSSSSSGAAKKSTRGRIKQK